MRALKIILLSIVGFLPTLAPAEERAIQVLMNDYWTAWTNGDFEKAAKFILRGDLKDARASLLPVFIEAQNRTSNDTTEILATFFGEARNGDRASLSKEEVFIGLNRVISTALADSFDLLSRTTTSITDVTFHNENSAILRYTMLLDGDALAEDFERAVRINGEWFLRLKEDPKITASKFEMLFRE